MCNGRTCKAYLMSYSIQWWTGVAGQNEGPLRLCYFMERNYMYKLRETFCSENPVFSLFLLFSTGNGCYVNRIYDSEGGTDSAHSVLKATVWIWILPRLDLIYTYRLSQEECARLRESVSYVKLYRYNPKHLCPKLNGYRDNGQRKVWSSCGSTYSTPSVTSYLSNAPARQLDMVMQWPWCVRYSAW